MAFAIDPGAAGIRVAQWNDQGQPERILLDQTLTVETVLAALPTRQAPILATAAADSLNETKLVHPALAAAAYWLWQLTEVHPQTLWVCDIGAASLDLARIRVETREQSLQLVETVRFEQAGQYVDAMICAQVSQQYNRTHASSYPETATDWLSAEQAWQQTWLATARIMKEALSTRIARQRQRLWPVQALFAPPEGPTLTIQLDVEMLQTLLEPYYQEIRTQLQGPLAVHPEETLLLTGGAARLTGIPEHIPTARFISQRHRLPDVTVLGAALIAAGKITVQQTLTQDIGLRVVIPPRVAAALKLPKKTQAILLTPLLAQGTALPATLESTALGLIHVTAPDQTLDIELWIQPQTGAWPLRWHLPNPTSQPQSVPWRLRMGADGHLEMQLWPQGGEPVTVTAHLTRPQETNETLNLPPIRPEALRTAIAELNPGNAP